MPRKKRGLDIPGQRTMEGSAQLWKRAAAFIIDLIVLDFIIIFPFKKYIDSILPSNDYSSAIEFISSNTGSAQALTLILIMISFLVILYFSILESKIGQTLGKYIFNIYVRKEDKGNLSFWRCVLSNLTLIPIFPFVILWIIDPIHMLFSRKKQRLMEKFTKIVVVQKYNI